MNHLIEIRKEMKDKKPLFIRRDTHKKKKLERNWRKPTGLDSKIRRKLKGRQKRISQGYRSPVKVRGLHKSGLKTIRVCSLKDLEGLDSKKECVVIASPTGTRKKIEILAKAKSLGLLIINSNIEENTQKVQEKIASRKKAEKKEKPVGKMPAKAEQATENDRKEAEKKEKEKILIQKEI